MKFLGFCFDCNYGYFNLRSFIQNHIFSSGSTLTWRRTCGWVLLLLDTCSTLKQNICRLQVIVENGKLESHGFKLFDEQLLLHVQIFNEFCRMLGGICVLLWVVFGRFEILLSGSVPMKNSHVLMLFQQIDKERNS